MRRRRSTATRHSAKRNSKLRLEPLENRKMLASISGEVWNDWNQDGIREQEDSDLEHRVADVTVNLINDNQVIATVKTNPEGAYDFSGLDAGDYVVEFVPPDDVGFAPENAGGNLRDKKDSDVQPNTGRTRSMRLERNSVIEHVDAGMVAPFGSQSITGRVWDDRNGNGIQEDGEPGIRGAEIQLENRFHENQVIVFTNDFGIFTIDGRRVLPGQYLVHFKRPPRNGGLPDWKISPQFAGGDDGNPQAVDSDADASSGRTDLFNVVALAEDAEPDSIDLDAGFFHAAQIRGRIWNDANQDGRRINEYGAAGFIVELLNENDEIVATRTSDENGEYRFAVADDRYAVRFQLPEGVQFSERGVGGINNDSDIDPLTGRSDFYSVSKTDLDLYLDAGVYSKFGTETLVGRVWHDLNGDGAQTQNEPGISGVEIQVENAQQEKLFEVVTDRLGNYTVPGDTLLPGVYFLDFEDPNDDDDLWEISPRNVANGVDSRLDNDAQPHNGRTPRILLTPRTSARDSVRLIDRDAGFFQFGKIFGGVWDDSNKDGYRDADEVGLPGVAIDLLNGQGHVESTAYSNKDGVYRFDSILPGKDYRVQIQTTDSIGFSPRVSGPIDRISQIDPQTRMSATFDVVSSQRIDLWAAANGNTLSTEIQGSVWQDFNGDGIRGANEPGLVGLTVRAFGPLHVLETKTDPSGNFAFTEIWPGAYHLEFERPALGTFSPMDRGTDDSLDSDVNRWTGRTGNYPLVLGQIEDSIDVGIYQGELSDNVVDNLRVTEVAFIGHGETEFTEVKNIGDQPLDLTGVRFVRGVNFDFSTSTTTSLFPDEHAILIGKRNTLAKRFDLQEINIAGQYFGDLNQEEGIQLVDRREKTVSEFKYDDDWFVIMDDEFLPWTLTILDEYAPIEDWNQRKNWRPSSFQAGSPGFDDPRSTPDPGAVVINEVMTKSSDGFNDLIELHNTTDADIDIGNWFLGDRTAGQRPPELYLRRYRITPGTIIPANGYLVFSRQDHFANPVDPGTAHEFGLSSRGESVHLVAGDAFGNLLGYSDSATFYGTQVDVSYGRTVLGDGTSAFGMMETATIGSTNSAPRIGPVVIDQIMYKPSEESAEYIRLFNSSDEDIPLTNEFGGWSISGGISYTFGGGIEAPVIPAGGRILVVSIEPADYRREYQIPDEIQIFGPFDSLLNNAGEDVMLRFPDIEDRHVLMDRVEYDNRSPWPIEATEFNVALMRVSSDVLGDDPTNWTFSQQPIGSHLSNGFFVKPFAVTGAAQFYGHDSVGLAVVQARPGDANGDGIFDSRDLVSIFQASKFRRDQPADWTEGDWNLDGRFNETDLVIAFQLGDYMAAALPAPPQAMDFSRTTDKAAITAEIAIDLVFADAEKKDEKAFCGIRGIVGQVANPFAQRRGIFL